MHLQQSYFNECIRLGQYNHASLTVPKVGHKLGSSTGVDSRCTPTTSDALGETLSSAGDTDGAGVGDAACYGKKILILHLRLEQIEPVFPSSGPQPVYMLESCCQAIVRVEIRHPSELRSHISHSHIKAMPSRRKQYKNLGKVAPIGGPGNNHQGQCLIPSSHRLPALLSARNYPVFRKGRRIKVSDDKKSAGLIM